MGNDDREVHLQLFKQLKLQFYKEDGERSTLETLKENLGGDVLKEVSLIYQRMNKKSEPTKIKALGTLLTLLHNKDPQFLDQLMASWIVIHDKLVVSENHPAIHSGAMQINKYIIQNNKLAFKKNFRAIFPSMFLSSVDNFARNQELAQNNLLDLVKDEEKLGMAVLMCQDGFFQYIKSFLIHPPEQFKEINIYLEDDQCERIHTRVLYLVISSLEKAVELVDNLEGSEKFNEKIITLLNINENGNVLTHIFNFKKKSTLVRASIASLFQTLLNLEVVDVSQSEIFGVCRLFLYSLDLREPKLQNTFWGEGLAYDCLEKVLPSFNKIDEKKIENNILASVAMGGMGSGKDYYTELLKFVKDLKIYSVNKEEIQKKEYKKLKKVFLKKSTYQVTLVENMMNACHLEDAKNNYTLHFQTLMSIIGFFLVEDVLPIKLQLKQILQTEEDPQNPPQSYINLIEEVDKLIERLFLMPLEKFVSENKSSTMQKSISRAQRRQRDQNREDPMSEIPEAYLNLFENMDSSKEQIFEELEEEIKAVFTKFSSKIDQPKNKTDSQKLGRVEFENYLVLMHDLGSHDLKETVAGKVFSSFYSKLFTFLEDFIAKNLKIESALDLEDQYSESQFNNLLVFLINVTKRNSERDDSLMKITKSLVEETTRLLTLIVQEEIDLFESNNIKFKIVAFLSKVLYVSSRWAINFQAVSADPYNKLVETLYPIIEDIEKRSQTKGGEKTLGQLADQISFLYVLFMPTIDTYKLSAWVDAGGSSLLESKREVSNLVQGLSHEKDAHDILSADQIEFIWSSSPQIKFVFNGLMSSFLRFKKQKSMILYPILSKFANNFTVEETCRQYLPYLRKPAALEEDTNLESKLEILKLLFQRTHENEINGIKFALVEDVFNASNFETPRACLLIEDFIKLLPSGHLNKFVAILCKQTSLYLVRFDDFDQEKNEYLLKLMTHMFKYVIREEVLDQKWAKFILDEAFCTKNLKGMLSKGLIWEFFGIVISQLSSIIDIGGYIRARFEALFQQEEQSEEELLLFQTLTSCSSCIKVVLTYSLKQKYTKLLSESVFPLFVELAVTDFDKFEHYIKRTLEVAASSEILFVLGVQKLIQVVSGSQDITDAELGSRVSQLAINITSYSASVEGAGKNENLKKASNKIQLDVTLSNYFWASLHNRNFKEANIIQRLEELTKTNLPSMAPAVDSPEPRGVKDLEYLQTLNDVLNIARQTKSTEIGRDAISQHLLSLEISTSLDGKSSPTKSHRAQRVLFLQLFFKFVNYLLEIQEFEVMAEHISKIESCYMEGLDLSGSEDEETEVELMVSLLEFLRKVVTILDMFSKSFEENIMNTVLQTSLNKISEVVQLKADGIEDARQFELGHDKLVVEIAETLSRFCISLKKDVSEDKLLDLIDCGVPVIQKSAFILLNYYHENISQPIELEVTKEQFKEDLAARKYMSLKLIGMLENKRVEVVSKYKKNFKKRNRKSDRVSVLAELALADTEDDDSQFYGYVLVWTVFMNKLSATKRKSPECYDLRLYFEFLKKEAGVYHALLNSLVGWIDKHNLPEKELYKQIEEVDFLKQEIKWTEFVDFSAALEIVMHAFYRFCSMFPRFLRDWIDRDGNRLSVISTKLIENFVSPALFELEANNIINSQHCKYLDSHRPRNIISNIIRVE